MHDHDNDDALAGIDLAAWQPPAPPSDLADAVIARVRQPGGVAAVEVPARAHRRFAWLAAVTAVAAVAAGLVIWDVTLGSSRGASPVATGPTHPALDRSSGELAPQPGREPAAAGVSSEPARVDPPPSPPVAAPARTVRAERKCSDDIVVAETEEAAHQFASGNPQPALFLMLHVLDCKQDVRLFRIAAVYACAASDEPIARMLFKKLPAAPYRNAVEQKCLQNGIDLTKP